jgi:hypothetical protein
MSPLDVFVPFTLFTEYRNRRAGVSPSDVPHPGVVTPDVSHERARVDTSFASADPAVRVETTTERIPS